MDALALRDSLPRLNEVFTDPAVPKIFAGEESQLRALQRDASVFTVNLFSLQQAARVLAIPQTDICALLKRFAGVEVKLLPETADWRVRPLAGKWRGDDAFYAVFVRLSAKRPVGEFPAGVESGGHDDQG